MWQSRAFRHTFSVITVVWGMAFLAETAAQVAIIESVSASMAKTTSNLMPVVVAGLVFAWTGIYGRRQPARAEREAMTAKIEVAGATGAEASLAAAKP